MADRSSSVTLRTRIGRVAVIVTYVVLAALLIVDIVQIERTNILVRQVRAHRLVDVAASIDRARAVFPVIAVAALEAGGDSAVLELPNGHETLLARRRDKFNGRKTYGLDMKLIGPFLGERIRETPYGAVLSSEDARAIESDPGVVSLPMDVWALPSADGAAAVRLYTDPTRIRVYIAPVGMFEGGSM